MASPLPGLDTGDAVDSVAHVIQVALTPVFLLSGIGTLLNVFNTRLSRVADHREHVAELLRSETGEAERARLAAHMVRLRRRTIVMDASVLLSAVGGASTCGSAFVLFLGSMRDTAIASWLYALFGLALTCTALALVAFLIDSVLAWIGLRELGSLPRPKP